MDISLLLAQFSADIWSMPFLIFFFGTCIFMTLQLGFVQFRYFAESIRLVFKPQTNADKVSASGALSPFQAFMNTLGGNIGNGSLSGIPVAIVAGGPGAIFWLLIMSTFAISLRFSEVFLSVHFSDKSTSKKSGPMYYLSLLPGGATVSYLFALFGFLFMVIGGNMVQCNAVGGALTRAWNIDATITAFIIFALVGYVVIGGSARIVKFLDKLVPVKVYGFLISALIVLVYNYAAIPAAIALIFYSALTPQAILGGTFAFALQESVKWGFLVGANAGESGLGTAAVAFGTSKGQDPVKSGIMSMLSVYINTHMVGFLVALCVLSSGVWNNGETSVMLLISAYETVFGTMAGWIISVLVALFATSAVVAFAFISKSCWDSLFPVKISFVFPLFYAGCALLGTMMKPVMLISICGIATAGLFVTNVAGLFWFIKIIKSNLKAYRS
jgi:alanine or glycine:cation symporter, AGCS family